MLVPLLVLGATVPLAWAYWHFPTIDQQRLGSYYVRGHVLLIAAALAGARLDTIRSDAQRPAVDHRLNVGGTCRPRT
jgi:hypothetical protein